MPTKQYVNLDPAVPDQLKGLDKKRAGKNITFIAKLKKSLAGHPIMFEVTLGAKNISASLDTGNFTKKELRAIAKRAVGGAGLPGSLKRRVMTDAHGKAKMKLVLSECGGDEFTITAYVPKGKGKGKELKSETFVVWRRLYFQVSRFKSGPKGAGRTGTLAEIPALDWAPVITEYEAREHNIELVDDSGTDLITRYCNVLDADPDYKKSAREGYDAKREPVTIRAVLVNQIGSPAFRQMVFPAVKEDVDLTQSVNAPLWFDESMDLKKDFIVEAKWRFKGDAVATEQDIPLDYIEAVGKTKIKINFKDIPKRHLFDFWRTATVRLKLRVSTGSTNGVSWYNTVWMANENMHNGARTVGAKQQTTIHEVGHYIGMAAAAQSTHYVDHDHTGPHCSTGLSATDLLSLHYGGMAGTCIMFGESATSRVPKFCAVCDPFIRSRGIPAKTMPADW
jgi:hypothetical protein